MLVGWNHRGLLNVEEEVQRLAPLFIVLRGLGTQPPLFLSWWCDLNLPVSRRLLKLRFKVELVVHRAQIHPSAGFLRSIIGVHSRVKVGEHPVASQRKKSPLPHRPPNTHLAKPIAPLI